MNNNMIKILGATAVCSLMGTIALAAPGGHLEPVDGSEDGQEEGSLVGRESEPLNLQNPSMSTAGTVTVSKIYSGTQLGAGASREIWWNNAAGASVYSFTAYPVVLTGATGCMEITRVWSTAAGNPQEREIHLNVKNCGTATVNYDVYMAVMK